MKPKYQISANDNDITKLIQSRLMSLTISDEIGLVSDTMTLELDDRDSAFALPAFGAVLDVALGIADGTYSLTLETVGNPMLGAESVIDIQVGRPEFRGKWVIKSCRHTLNSSGFKTSVEATKTREASNHTATNNCWRE